MRQDAGGIEDVFSRCVAGRHSPYRWLARSISATATVVLDVACGTGAVAKELERPERLVIGLDHDAGVLRRAHERGTGPLVQADALALPFGDSTFDAATTSMGLAVIGDTAALLAELARVLKPGGVLAGLLPTILPSSGGDIALAAQLSWRLRTPLRFPGDIRIGFTRACAAAGLTKVEDARERYRYPIHSRDDAERLVRELDLTGVSERRIESAIELLGSRVIGSGGVDVAIPLRRVLAIK